jgi:hypothetical protein
MTNFEDFIKVAQEAKKNLDNMQIHLSDSKTELAEIKQNKYESIYKFWQEVSDMLWELGCGNTQIFMPTPITYIRGGQNYKVYFNIWMKSYASIELGVYAAYDGISIDSGWRRWMYIPTTYQEYVCKNDDGLSDIVKLMYENWEEYQPKFEVAVKEMVTEYLAQQLRKTEEEFVNVQNNIESENS